MNNAPESPPESSRQPSATPPEREKVPARRGSRFGWAEAMVLVGVVTMAMGAFVALYVVRKASSATASIANSATEMVEQATAGAIDFARAFRQGTVTSTFFSHATEVSGNSRLQFATLDQTEVFERKDSASVLWGQLDLPDIVVEARTPVEYTYYLDLAKEWNFTLEGDDVVVFAPLIEFNRPAIDASRMVFEVREDSVLRDSSEAIEKLRRGITPTLQRRARRNIPLVREIGRRQTEEFIANWLLREFPEAPRDLNVRVVFADEDEGLRDGSLSVPDND